MIKCVIFDLDGTLLDTIDTIRFHLNNTLVANGAAPISREECRQFVGNGARKLVRRAMGELGSDEALFDKIYSEYVAAYDREPYHLTRAYDGITELVTELRSRGILLGVLSNKPDYATRAAASRFFGDSFHLVRGAREGVELKPAPDAAISMLQELDVTPEETAYVGDSDVDVLTAKSFSAALAVSVLWGFRGKEELLSVGANVFATTADELFKIITEF